jgi:hypothetical protein
VILLRLAAICGLRYEKDWDFRVTGATPELEERKRVVLLGQKLIDELSKL